MSIIVKHIYVTAEKIQFIIFISNWMMTSVFVTHHRVQFMNYE